MSTASRYRATVCKARAACRNAAGVPGAGQTSPAHYDAGAPVGFPLGGRALLRNVPDGSGQPRMTQVIRSVYQGHAKILAPEGGFPSPPTTNHRRKAAQKHFPPPCFARHPAKPQGEVGLHLAMPP